MFFVFSLIEKKEKEKPKASAVRRSRVASEVPIRRVEEEREEIVEVEEEDVAEYPRQRHADVVEQHAFLNAHAARLLELLHTLFEFVLKKMGDGEIKAGFRRRSVLLFQIFLVTLFGA